MGFQGYGGSELDHSDCLISPCSACLNQREQQQPSSRSGNTLSSSFNNPNDQGSRANVFGQENRASNEAAHATRAGAAADNTGGLSGGLQNLSISDEDRTLRDEMRQTGFNIPPAPQEPGLRHQAGSQNLREAAGFQSQNQPQLDDGRIHLSDEDRTLRDEMRRTGFRIPLASDLPALSRPDGSQNRSDTTGLQSPYQNQTDSITPGEATGSYPPEPSAPTSRFICPCSGCRSGLLPCSYAPPEEPTNRMTDGLAPWAYDHPTTEDTLRRVLRNKFLASQGRPQGQSQGSLGNPQPSTQPAAAPQGQTGRPEVPIVRLTRLDGSEMQLDETYDWETANERRVPVTSKGQAEGKNQRGW